MFPDEWRKFFLSSKKNTYGPEKISEARIYTYIIKGLLV